SHFYDTVRALTYQNTDVFLICFHLGDWYSLHNALNKWYPEVRKYSLPDTPIVLVGCQNDQRYVENLYASFHLVQNSVTGAISPLTSAVNEVKQRVVYTEEALEVCRQMGAVTYVETCAYNSSTVREAFEISSFSSLEMCFRMLSTETFFLLLLLAFSTTVHATEELFSAIVHLERLLQTEQSIVANLNSYLDYEEKRIASLRQLAHHYNELNSVASKDVQSYLSNPVNAYLLVKRLTTDWKLVEYLTFNADRRDLIEFLQQNETFPSSDDLTGAAEALLRLQDTYKLDTSLLADGVIPIRDVRGMKPADYLKPGFTSMSLTANDCFELGRQAYSNEDYHHTKLWMREALSRLENEESDSSTQDKMRINILEHLAFSTYKLGYVSDAYTYTMQLLELDPDHERARGNIQYFDKELNIKNQIRRVRKGDDGDDAVSVENSIAESSWPIEETERQTYEALCRGESRLSERTRSQLVCFHLDTSKSIDPYLRLTNIKVEEAYKQPQIVIFHDFMSDAEAEVIKALAAPKLKRATVQNYFTGNLETAKYRISKSAWLTDRDHHVVARISRRVQAITDLDLSTAEELQVVNYGIAGQYEPHYDFARREEKNAFKSLGTGNRIATWLNYMSDVEAGGATVFTQLGVTVWPKKNSAAFWYNLHKSGDGDLLTRHAACPVLLGSKWVSNKWIHERGQEFRKKCGVSPFEPNLVQKTN
ncbi:PREDICTED: prolyl 4-hydroxylase subunit alpha-1-like, partial [Rhagoletis zephyria]|uniref:prolyl 4-hydroxylase subunit alpha-1-like n=1 Tax=Rhagoletis zephyria TaxID=28612 RepID=UPI000811292F